MANKPISDNTAFPFETNVRLIDGIAGFKTGTPNTNTKISGPGLVTSVINSNGSGSPSTSTVGRLAFYGLGGNSLGGSGGLNWDNPNYTLIIGNSSFKGALEIFGNYDTGNTQPRITLHGGENVGPNNFDFIITTAEDAVDQTWILPNTLPTAGQVLEANAVSTNDVTLSWVTAGSGGGSLTPTTQTTNYSASANDFVICNVTTSLRVTLPAAAAGAIVGVKYASQNAPADVCDILTPSAGVTIDGVDRSSTALVLPSLNTYYELISDGTNWFIK